MKFKRQKIFTDKEGEALFRRSSPATCGIMEREVVVASNKVEAVKRKLRSEGFMIIGTSEAGGKTRKVWFIIRGGF